MVQHVHVAHVCMKEWAGGTPASSTGRQTTENVTGPFACLHACLGGEERRRRNSRGVRPSGKRRYVTNP